MDSIIPAVLLAMIAGLAGVLIGALAFRRDISNVLLRGSAMVLLMAELEGRGPAVAGPLSQQVAKKLRYHLGVLGERIGSLDALRAVGSSDDDLFASSQEVINERYQIVYRLMGLACITGFGDKIFPELLKLPSYIEAGKAKWSSIYTR